MFWLIVCGPREQEVGAFFITCSKLGIAGFASRLLSSDSHDDFKSEVKFTTPTSAIDSIKHDVTNNKVMVYMKVRIRVPRRLHSAFGTSQFATY